MTQQRVLSVTNLTKNYGEKTAVKDISFRVHANEIVGLVGPNGAGKTTTINMILGALEPTAGEIKIEDIDLKAKRQQALRNTNFAAVYSPLPGNLTIEQNFKIFGAIYEVKHLKSRINEVLAEFDLERFRNMKLGVLSSGEQMRVSIAKALLNKPNLLLLDEATASMDPSISHDIRQMVKTYVGRAGVGVLWTSHNMYEVEQICDRVLLLSDGKIVLEGNPRELPQKYGEKTLEELFIKLANRKPNEH